jgi:hypothetical protein
MHAFVYLAVFVYFAMCFFAGWGFADFVQIFFLRRKD